jgi:predicted HTH transcriptional regulator
MIFGNRRISHINDSELIGLIDTQYEDQWIEFKANDQVHIGDMCKDITAMANAEGGYIFIGVREQAGLAQDFVGVNNPDTLVNNIRSCLPNIDPPIDGLDVAPRTFVWNGRTITLVIIHIPPSSIYPHGFIWNGTNNFVKRYGAEVQAYSTYSLSVDFFPESVT